MLGQLVHRLQSLSPLTSPVPSPISSPKIRSKFGIRGPIRARRQFRELQRDVQSEPEPDCEDESSTPATFSLSSLQLSKHDGRSKSTMKIRRLEQHDRYLQGMRREERCAFLSDQDVNLVTSRVSELLGEKENSDDAATDLDRIQELFPNNSLGLYDKEALSTGLRIQDRHLFLFTDLLFVAKPRAGGCFKLKEKVRVSELWLADCVDDVADARRSRDTSFVIGWPTVNVVACFSAPATKDLWYSKLNEVSSAEALKEPPSTTIQIYFFDAARNIEYLKTLCLSPKTTAKECIRMALDHLEMKDADPAQFRLWVRTVDDVNYYPLIGHEYPFSIKMNALRELLLDERVYDLHASCNTTFFRSEASSRCHFILRSAISYPFSESEEAKKFKKSKKAPIMKVFRRSCSKADVMDGQFSSGATGLLFGQPLPSLCQAGQLPKPVMDMLMQLFLKGPFTHGIFRKSANARQIRELRSKLDSEFDVPLDDINVFTLAALVKDFFRSLPDCLLGSHLYEEWTELTKAGLGKSKICRLQCLLSRLDQSNVALLQHFLCVLHHIADRAYDNMMTAFNLAVCVGPSLLWSKNGFLFSVPEASKHIPVLVEFLISSCVDIFGVEVLKLFGKPPSVDPTKQDSGAEESDSHSFFNGRRDDSSLDSLEKEFLEDAAGLPHRNKMSLTNLSRDSGLTLSDSQLYTPDDDEDSSSASNLSSSGHGSEPPRCASSSSCSPSGVKQPIRESLSCDTEKEPRFQRQGWFRKGSGARGSSREEDDDDDEEEEEEEATMRRSCSEDSLSSGRSSKRPALHRKGPAPLPPDIRIYPSHRVVIENSSKGPASGNSGASTAPEGCHHHQQQQQQRPFPGAADWKRSHSTSHIDEADRSYDSSTLSDDDSTPHVSRSNSRGHDSISGATVYRITDLGRTASQSTVKSADSSSTLTSCVSTPPSYEETMSRRSLLRAHSVHSILESAGAPGAGGGADGLLRLAPQPQSPFPQELRFLKGADEDPLPKFEVACPLACHGEHRYAGAAPCVCIQSESISGQILVAKRMLSRVSAFPLLSVKNSVETQTDSQSRFVDKTHVDKQIQIPEDKYSFVTNVEVKSRMFDSMCEALKGKDDDASSALGGALSTCRSPTPGGRVNRRPEAKGQPAVGRQEINWSVAHLRTLFSADPPAPAPPPPPPAPQTPCPQAKHRTHVAGRVAVAATPAQPPSCLSRLRLGGHRKDVLDVPASSQSFVDVSYV